jgi:hypothetical protein
MKPPQCDLAEFLLAGVFIGLFTSLAVRIWGGFFFIHGLVMSAAVLFPTYVLLVLMTRRHRWRQDDLRNH